LADKTETETETETEKKEGNITALNGRSVSQSETSPDTSGEKIETPKAEKVPYRKIIEIYHEECPDLPRVKVLNETRKRLLRARWKEKPDLNFWREYFKKVHKSDFLCGRVDPRDGRQPFIADFEWLIRPSNFAKVLEGRYDNRDSPKHSDPDIEAVLREFRRRGGAKDE